MENNDLENQLLLEKKNKPKINYSFFIQLLTLTCTIASISINFYYFTMFQSHLNDLPSAASFQDLNQTLKNVSKLEDKFDKVFNYLCKDYKICF